MINKKNITKEKVKSTLVSFEKEIEHFGIKFGEATLIGVNILLICFILIQYTMQKTAILWLPVFLILLILACLLGKDYVENKKRFFFFVKMGLTLLAIATINHGAVELLNYFNFPSALSAALIRLTLFANFSLLVGSYLFFKKEKVQQFFQELEENTLIDMIKRDNSVTLKAGDVKICNDAETGEPIYWFYSDRFLHMLILGPTGSGKTSQILAPLINQDLQNRDAGITLIEPKGDFAEQVQAMAEYHGRSEETTYFNPIMPNCPSFNPLFGPEAEVIENITTTFNSFSQGSSDFFKNANETLVRNALRVLKRMLGDDVTFIDFNRFIHNSAGYGDKLLNDFSRKMSGLKNAKNELVFKENEDLIAYFKDDYFSDTSRMYEHCSALRSQVSKLISNPHLRRVLNPLNGGSDVDFKEHLEKGHVMAISTAQGELRDLSRFLGYFIILQFQSSVFKRPGNEDSRKGHFLYIDEFQTYANSGFADMLTQGRSYRVASHLATQNRSLIGANSGQDARNFIELVSTNARNVVIFPGGNADDARYYSETFGEVSVTEKQVGITRQRFNPLKGIRPMNYDSESIREVEVDKYLFTPTEIMKKEFKSVIVSLIQDNSVQPARLGKVEFIDSETYTYVKKRVIEFHKEISDFKKRIYEEEEEQNQVFYNQNKKKEEEEEEVIMKKSSEKSSKIGSVSDGSLSYSEAKKKIRETEDLSFFDDHFSDDDSSPFGSDVVEDGMRNTMFENHSFTEDEI